MKAVFLAILRVGLATSLAAGAVCSHAQEPLKQDAIFPIVLYNHLSQTTVQRMIEVMDNAQEHGFNTVNVVGAGEDAEAILAHAQKKGMAISGFCDTLHPFKGKNLPGLCVHSPDYKTILHEALEAKRTNYESVPGLWVATIVDEPCVDNRIGHRDPAPSHAGFICRCEHCQRLFQAKYGVALPDKMPSMDEPIFRRQYVEFYDDYWAKVWKLSSEYLKANQRDLQIASTFTENLCFGRHYDLVFGDLLNWSEPLDWIAADIYPYYYGRNENDTDAIEWDMKRSRLLMAFLRCAGRHHGIPFAWWVGCTSSTEETPKAIRHMSYVAIGQGAQGLIGWGAYFPETRPVLEYNPALWEDAGKTFRDISKAGPLLRHLTKTARIALLASETEALCATPRQYAGPFYYDLCPAYDALLKAFGDADLIYERQIAAGGLKDYEALVIANVRHVSTAAAEEIERFVREGGVLISDTVPELNEDNKASMTLAKVFGRTESGKPRRLHYGAPDEFPQAFRSEYGKGKVLLLRFRIGSFYNVPGLWELVRSWLQANGVDPLAVSSNPDIESNYLVGKDCFVIIAVNRKREDGATEIQVFPTAFYARAGARSDQRRRAAV